MPDKIRHVYKLAPMLKKTITHLTRTGRQTRLLTILFCYIQTFSFGQLLKMNDFEDNGIIFKYETDYETVVKKNKVKQATSSNVPYGNSTMYEYDLNGRIIKTDRQPDPHNNGYRKYDSLGRLIEKAEVNMVNATKTDTLQIIKFKYDEKNKIKKKTIWYKKKTEYGSDIMQQKRFTNKLEEFEYVNLYNGKNQLIKQQQFSGDTLYGTLLYKYDANGNLFDFQILYKDISIFRHFVLKYDSLNRVTNIKYVEVFDGIERNVVYNEKGQVISEYKQIAYFPNGLIKTISQYNDNEGLDLVNTFQYRYYK